MRGLGLILIAIGFIGGSLTAVIHPAEVEHLIHLPLGLGTVAHAEPGGIDWALFIPLLAVGAVGVVLVQIAIRREATDVTLIAANFEALDSRLRKLVATVSELDDTKTDIDTYDLPAWIDERVPHDILAFVEARESIRYAWGADAYAEVMSHFAAGERYLNRVWSCAADGYIDEAHEYIGRSREQLSEALARFEALGEARTPAAAGKATE